MTLLGTHIKLSHPQLCWCKVGAGPASVQGALRADVFGEGPAMAGIQDAVASWLEVGRDETSV